MKEIGVEKPKQQTVQQATTNVKEVVTPFDNDSLVREWDNYAATIDKKVYLKNTMINCKPVLQDNYYFEVCVHNPGQQDELTNNCIDILSYLRMQLKNTRIQMRVRIDETNQKHLAYTSAEKYEHLLNITLDKVKSLLDKYEASKTLIDNNKPYVIVIDEFNRGNVSKIFGELITLLEPDKRKGMRNAESVLLPYSKKEFYIPSNVFLVATMNTADRSLDTIDYAIRRRFAFITVKPQEIDDDNFNSELFREVSSLFISNYDEYAESGFDDTIKLLPAETLSEEYRPEDVWIGHSYFIMDGEYALQDRLLFEIIPLLEEYIRDGVLTSEAQQTIDKLYLTATEQ